MSFSRSIWLHVSISPDIDDIHSDTSLDLVNFVFEPITLEYAFRGFFLSHQLPI